MKSFKLRKGRIVLKVISIIIPAYNEEENLHNLYNRLKNVVDNLDYGYEFMFVNDGSKDNTLGIIKELKKKDPNISYVNLARNFGKEVAMAAAFDHVIGDAAVVIDADLQDPPEIIYDMVKYWEEGYDDVYAKRRSRKGETFVKKFTSKAFYKVLAKVSTVPIQEDTGDFRLVSRQFIDELKKLRECNRYTKGLFSWVGLKKKEIYFDRDPRAAGETKWNYFKLMDLAIEGIISSTTVPLKMATFLGILIGGIAFIYLIFIVAKTLIHGVDVPGYASIVSIILFLSGVQLVAIGIIGEYLARIFMESKHRPLYIVQEFKGREDKKE